MSLSLPSILRPPDAPIPILSSTTTTTTTTISSSSYSHSKRYDEEEKETDSISSKIHKSASAPLSLPLSLIQISPILHKTKHNHNHNGNGNGNHFNNPSENHGDESASSLIHSLSCPTAKLHLMELCKPQTEHEHEHDHEEGIESLDETQRQDFQDDISSYHTARGRGRGRGPLEIVWDENYRYRYSCLHQQQQQQQHDHGQDILCSSSTREYSTSTKTSSGVHIQKSQMHIASGTIQFNHHNHALHAPQPQQRNRSHNHNRSHNRNHDRNEHRHVHKIHIVEPYIILPTEDPADVHGIPCLIRGYSIPHCYRSRSRATLNPDHSDPSNPKSNKMKPTEESESISTSTKHHDDDVDCDEYVCEAGADAAKVTMVPAPAPQPAPQPEPEPVRITNGTLVQILPPIQSEWMDPDRHLCSLPIEFASCKTMDASASAAASAAASALSDSHFDANTIMWNGAKGIPGVFRDYVHSPDLKSYLSGELKRTVDLNAQSQKDDDDDDDTDDDDDEDDQVLLSHEQETVHALTIRMRMLMENDYDTDTDAGSMSMSKSRWREVMVGTTEDAVQRWEEGMSRRKRLNAALKSWTARRRWGASASASASTDSGKNDGVAPDSSTVQSKPSAANDFLHDGALTVHDPTHGSGKTTLVASIARKKLKCDAVHVIQASTLFAQYGASGADAALESLLHGIVVSAAARYMGVHGSGSGSGSICIILDQLETFLPPGMSGGRNTGDPAIPALNAIRAYLIKVVEMLRDKRTFPYPTKNPFYNVNGKEGYVLPVKICVVGIVTCDDDGGRKASGLGYNVGTVLDALGENRYRLPSPSLKGGCKICMQLFEKHKIVLDADATDELPSFLSALQSIKGSLLRMIADKLNLIIQAKNKGGNAREKLANYHDLRTAFIAAGGKGNEVSISIPKSKSKIADDKGQDLFSSIGGNDKAKKALVDALAFDERKRRILARFGMSPPSGVLLYGPPGTGKTLLAKATALMMQPNKSEEGVNQGRVRPGGLFISLSASEIVRSEVGKSEKLVASAFQTARDNAPSVIFIDEFQALFTSRGGNGSGSKSSGRLASTLLQCMDDIVKWREADIVVATEGIDEASEANRVVVLGATNTPWMVDRAFLRAGRFDRVVHVGLPNDTERESILKVYVRNMKLSSSTSVDEVCKQLAGSVTAGFSGADLFALIRSAAVRCLNENVSGDMEGVELRHFLDAKAHDMTEPSSNKELVERLLHWRP